MTLDIFGFQALWSPFFLLTLVMISLIFIAATTMFRQKFNSASERLTSKQLSCFMVTILFLYIVKAHRSTCLGILCSAYI